MKAEDLEWFDKVTDKQLRDELVKGNLLAQKHTYTKLHQEKEKIKKDKLKPKRKVIVKKEKKQ